MSKYEREMAISVCRLCGKLPPIINGLCSACELQLNPRTCKNCGKSDGRPANVENLCGKCERPEEIPLWGSCHSYYCQEGNFYDSKQAQEYGSWADFLEVEGDADPDHNLVFRWDWFKPTRSYPEHQLLLFIIGQRRSILRSARVSVRAEDEPQIKAWLKVRFEHLYKLWAPFSVLAS